MKKFKGFSLSQQFVVFFVVSTIALVGFSEAQRLNRRRTTSTTTTEAPLSISSRESNLVARESNLNDREVKFREREVNLTLREEAVRLREQKIAVREENLKIRELKIEGEAAAATTTPAPDLGLVRFYNVTQKWEEIGSTEPCPENMRFFAIPGNMREGVCDCDYHQCSRPLLYSPKYDQCFWAWSQGPCEQGEFYAYNDTLHPVCIKNKCPQSLALRTSKYFYEDPDDRECYETTTQGYCQEPLEKLLTTYDDPIPKCRVKSVCQPLSNPPHQECIAGNKRHLEGLCE